LVWTHNKVEGKLEYTSLLYIPAKAPFDLWHANKSRGLKLYVQRVFIMDDVEQFLPHYLRFVRGIIDCNDLPLNISREILQNNRVIDSIRGALVKKILGTLSNLATQEPEQYAQFWQEFGQALKEGPAEDFANKEAIAKLFRFASTHTDQALQTVSLEDYVARMPAEQSKIYYVAAESFNAAKNSPHLEIFRKKGIEVVLLYDRVDEWTINHLEVFAGKNFQSVAKGSLDDLDFKKTEDTQAQDDSSESTKAEQEAQEEAFAETVKSMQTLLGEKVKTVRLTQRLTDSPSCLVADEGQMTSQMERILRSAGQMVASKPILELNPKHSLIQRLQQEAPETENFKVLSHILLDQAILAEGGQLDDPATFIKRFNELLLPQAS
jgi:molecular chaperone HtpG